MNYICTWLYVEDKDDESYYPQVGGSSARKEIQDIYWKCVFNFFHSSLKFNKNCKHIFFTNVKSEYPVLNNIDIKYFLESNNIELINIDLTNKTPLDWFGAWRNQFYIFDILKYIKLNFKNQDQFLILDSDCIFTKSISNLFQDVNENNGISLGMYYTENEKINGISKVEMTQIYNEILDKNEKLINYFGGEFFAANYNTIVSILGEFEEIWDKNFTLYIEKKLKLNEEAHFLSCIYRELNIDNSIGNNYTKRMWTAFSFNNIEKTDVDLPIWHLPAEKTTGSIYLFDYISRDYNKYLNINEDEYIKILKYNMGIPSRNLRKWIKDLIIYFKKKIQN